jgi:hypothetical protein
VRYPLTREQMHRGDRTAWPWFSGTVLERCGPDEWRVRVDASELGEDGTFPVCYQAASELRPAPVSAFRCPGCGDYVPWHPAGLPGLPGGWLRAGHGHHWRSGLVGLPAGEGVS